MKAETMEATMALNIRRVHSEGNQRSKISHTHIAEACGRRIFKLSSGLRRNCLAKVIGIDWNDEERVVMYEVRYENGIKEFLYGTEFLFVEEPIGRRGTKYRYSI
jgi:hypothetical protein